LAIALVETVEGRPFVHQVPHASFRLHYRDLLSAHVHLRLGLCGVRFWQVGVVFHGELVFGPA
jgi:hypothetical protein